MEDETSRELERKSRGNLFFIRKARAEEEEEEEGEEGEEGEGGEEGGETTEEEEEDEDDEKKAKRAGEAAADDDGGNEKMVAAFLGLPSGRDDKAARGKVGSGPLHTLPPLHRLHP